MTTVTATARYVEVEVDLEDIDTKDLLAELTARNISPSDLPTDAPHLLNKLHLALKFGQDAEALRLARAFVETSLGVIL